MNAVVVITPSELSQLIEQATARGVADALAKAARPATMTKAQVAAALQRCTKTVDRMVSSGEFPAPTNGRWPTATVDRWLSDRA
jgi:hypothetical protein